MHAIMLWLQRTRLELVAPIALWTLVEGLPLPHLEVRLEPRAQVHASRVGSSPVAVLRYLEQKIIAWSVKVLLDYVSLD